MNWSALLLWMWDNREDIQDFTEFVVDKIRQLLARHNGDPTAVTQEDFEAVFADWHGSLPPADLIFGDLLDEEP